MSLMFANSLLDGFLLSNGIGKGIVIAQLLGSVAMFATIIGKWRELRYVASASRRFLRDFSSGGNVLEYYFNRRPSATSGLERIYKDTCDRLLKLIAPEVRLLLGGKQPDHPGSASLTSREIELVRGTCENAMDEETIRVEGAMPSPTFTLMIPYEAKGRKLYHFDLYRLSDPDEYYAAGLDEFVGGDGVAVIEWPGMAELDPRPALRVHLERGAGDLARRIRIENDGVGGFDPTRLAEWSVDDGE